MMNHLKKICIAIAGIFVAGITPVNGDEANVASYCAPKCKIARENCCKDQANSEEKKCNNCQINLKAELLYWRPELCGLESVFGNTTIATTVNGSVITTTVTEVDKHPHFKWSPGFRVGADAVFDCFDLETDWTHYRGHANYRQSTQYGRWNIHYDAIDLFLARSWYVTSSLTLKPFIGARGAIIHQSLRSHSETLYTALIGNNIVSTDKKDKEHFWGVGPELGLEANWYLGCDFSLYGSVDVVSYYGEVKSKNYDVDTFTATVSISDGKKEHCFNAIGTDAAIGIRYDLCCDCCHDMNFMVKLGFEQHRIYDFSKLGSDGILSLDGGILALGVGFCY